MARVEPTLLPSSEVGPKQTDQERDLSARRHTGRTTTCEACGGIVSTAAAACPHCGHPVREFGGASVIADAQIRAQSQRKIFWRLVGFGILGLIAWFVISANNDADRKQRWEDAYLKLHPYTAREQEVRDHFGQCYGLKHFSFNMSERQLRAAMALRQCYDDNRDDPLYQEWTATIDRVEQGGKQLAQQGGLDGSVTISGGRLDNRKPPASPTASPPASSSTASDPVSHYVNLCLLDATERDQTLLKSRSRTQAAIDACRSRFITATHDQIVADCIDMTERLIANSITETGEKLSSPKIQKDMKDTLQYCESAEDK